MNRSKKHLNKRRKIIAITMQIKKTQKDYSWKKAIIEISEMFSISNATVRSELQKYNKDFTIV